MSSIASVVPVDLPGSLADTPDAALAAVVRLQQAARSGRPVLIPGALEPLRHRAVEAEAAGPRGPHADPARSDDREREGLEHDAGGTPAGPVTVMDRIQLLALRLTNALIRALGTSPPPARP